MIVLQFLTRSRKEEKKQIEMNVLCGIIGVASADFTLNFDGHQSWFIRIADLDRRNELLLLIDIAEKMRELETLQSVTLVAFYRR